VMWRGIDDSVTDDRCDAAAHSRSGPSSLRRRRHL
jgi:hypothetical protein